MTYISAIGTYLPRLRLSRSAMAAALGWLGGNAGSGKGARSLAFWDEDSITMGVEAARDCLSHPDVDPSAIRQLVFASTTPVFHEPQQASFLHAALRLQDDCLTQDSGGTVRCGLLALHQALEQTAPALVVAADMPVTLAASAAEARSGDGAAAVLVGTGQPLLNYLGGVSIAAPLIDRYQAVGYEAGVEWEERWLREEGYMRLMPQAIAAALHRSGLSADAIDCVVMPCLIAGCAPAVLKASGLHKTRLASTLALETGDTGSGHALLMLAHALDGMKAGETILLAQLGQGATVLIVQAQEAIAAHKTNLPAQLESGIAEDNYLKLVMFRGQLAWDRGLRGRTAVNEALSTSYRYHESLLGFVGGRCRETGLVQFPPSRLAASGTGYYLDTLDPYPLADIGGKVATFTADRLAFSRHPPNCYGLVDFNGGGRLMMDFTDPDAASLDSGDPVRFVFRIKDLDERTGYRRYFWKAVAARPAPASPSH